MTITVGSLCTGFGGLDLAVEEVFGAEMVWCSEIDPAASKVIEKRFPGVPNLGDLTKVDWKEVPAVDVITAGYLALPTVFAGWQEAGGLR